MITFGYLSNISSDLRFARNNKESNVFCRLVAKGRELDTKLKELEAQAEVIEAQTRNTFYLKI